MIFSSAPFIFLFLPITLGVFWLLNTQRNLRIVQVWLILASLFFYGFWKPVYLILLVGSLLFDYLVIRTMSRTDSKLANKVLVTFGVGVNLAILGYYKYANFFADTFNSLAGTSWNIAPVLLPLGISFFTFQKITYIIDTYQGKIAHHHFREYCLFVTFFPQLIAGPIVHHHEMIPQFPKLDIKFKNVTVGLTIFLMGVFKKVLLADSIAAYSDPVFFTVTKGLDVSFFDAWVGAFAYTLQLYFDFSGYSDMAIGLGQMFGLQLPMNFNSPYKAVDIIDFWRRWHMTLSRFLRDYVYIPLGGNRKGGVRRYVNLLLTMLIGGLWHGAGWAFVFWGGLHGIYLVINHGWRAVIKRFGLVNHTKTWWAIALARGITFLSVLVAWVFFRAEAWEPAIRMLQTMGNVYEISYLINMDFQVSLVFTKEEGFMALPWIGILLMVAWFAPNVQEIMAHEDPTIEPVEHPSRLMWRPTMATGIILGVLFALVIRGYFDLAPAAEFLYFNF